MTLQEQMILKIRQLPNNVVKQVNEFVDYILIDEEDEELLSLWEQFLSVSANYEIEFSDDFVSHEGLNSSSQLDELQICSLYKL